METGLMTNSITLRGVISEDYQYSHSSYGERFYTFKVGVERKSGYQDILNGMISERLLMGNEIQRGQRVKIIGQIRTYNEILPKKNRLNIIVFCKDILLYENFEDDDEFENLVMLQGFLCKEPLLRMSPLGRELCDIMLAVNRMYGKSDYIPCIAWGRNARYAGSLPVGKALIIEGRLQSRQYKKVEEDGFTSIKTAFEVSIIKVEEDVYT